MENLLGGTNSSFELAEESSKQKIEIWSEE